MGLVQAAIVLHVAMGGTWVLATLTVALTGWARPLWLKLLLGAALINMLAGIYLWHALHAGPWGPTERLLVFGTFCAFIALGMQTAVALTLPPTTRRLERPALWIYRVTAILVGAAATAMIASRYV